MPAWDRLQQLKLSVILLMLKRRSTTLVLLVASLIMQMGCGGNVPTPFSPAGGVSTGARPAPHFEPGFNLFSPEQDIELGRTSAQQISRQMPLLRDDRTVNYVRQLGAKLAAKAPGHRFPYQFNVVATRDINAFALPGGFIFVNAGAIAAAKNEGELAGVMAHEITHVALRHGTNQATKAYIARAGMGILGAIAGGTGSPDIQQVVNTIGGAGANVIFLKFGRTAEKQADLAGARILAESGYDPRDMANFFKTLEAKGGGQRVPEFLSDHPDPGNRIAAINNVLGSLRISERPVRNTEDFQQVKARLTSGRANSGGGGGALAASTSEARERTGPRDPNKIEPGGGRPAAPDRSLKGFQSPTGLFTVQYPQNWDALQAADEAGVILAPKGGHGQINGGIAVTHGILAGAIALPKGANLEAATRGFVQQQTESNPDFQVVRQPQATNISGRPGLATVVAGPSTVTSTVEVDVIYTTVSADGRFFYLITVVPEDELRVYEAAFRGIIASLRLTR